MHMPERRQLWPSENASEIISPRETGKDNYRGQDRHADVEHPVASLTYCCSVCSHTFTCREFFIFDFEKRRASYIKRRSTGLRCVRVGVCENYALLCFKLPNSCPG